MFKKKWGRTEVNFYGELDIVRPKRKITGALEQ